MTAPGPSSILSATTMLNIATWQPRPTSNPNIRQIAKRRVEGRNVTASNVASLRSSLIIFSWLQTGVNVICELARPSNPNLWRCGNPLQCAIDGLERLEIRRLVGLGMQ